jgi:tripartite-type tricarboxylate transporter receptor subunit TctC
MCKQIKAKLTGIPLLCFVFLFVFSIGLVYADFPERPITIIIAFDTGGALDAPVRAMASALEKHFDKSVVVENRGGGGGTVALGLIAGAKPDGYTLCCAPNVSIVNTPLMQKVPFKPLKSFAPIVAWAAAEHSAIIVKPDAPWKSFKEFVDYAKKNPGKIKYSTSGVGTGMHTIMDYIAHKEGIKWVHVPYKGSPQARIAVIGGHVDACSSGVDFAPYALSGTVRVLATQGQKRSPHFPNVPTLKELGYDVTNETIHSIVGPAALPKEIMAKLETGFAKAMETAEFKTAIERLYLTPLYMNGKEFEEHLKGYWPRTEKMFKDAGIIKEAATAPY